MTPNILFILKRREDFNPVKHSPKGLSTGLFNSASFMETMLNDSHITTNLEVAIDNNCIDKLVNKYRPTHVIIEALWVVPEKFQVLTKLHPKVKWIIRLHSEMPFMAGEGMAMDWIGDYVTYPQISIGVNAPRMLDEIRCYLQTKQRWSNKETNSRVVYMPNHYPQDFKTKKLEKSKYWVDIGCFGAVRPLKNHLLQAFAALKFAKKINKQLRFHINVGRVEMKGDPVLNNLQKFFIQLSDEGHQLVMHEWTPREGFLQLCSQMDLGMQCNFSETFNIVGADLISQGVPLIGTSEIPWSSDIFNADATESDDICDALLRSYRWPQLNVYLNQSSLRSYTNKTSRIWSKYFNGEI